MYRPAPRRPSSGWLPGALLALCTVLGPSSPARADIVVHDDAGREIRLASPASRVVSLSPHLTEALFEIGAAAKVAAVTDSSDYPDAARGLPRVGGLGAIDLERMTLLHPDLVVAWRSGTSENELRAIERLGIPVYRSEPTRFDDVASTFERLGVLIGDVDRGRRTAAAFRARVATLRARYAGRPPVRVMVQVWRRPLMTVGGPHILTEAIALCGGRNVFDKLAALAPTIDAEAVLAADPQLLVATSAPGSDPEDLASWSAWRGVSAVRHRRYLFVHPDLLTRQTSRLLDGTEALCRAIDAARADGA